jgi:hypothetical protein
MAHCRYVYMVDRDTIVVYNVPTCWELISRLVSSSLLLSSVEVGYYMNHSSMVVPTLLIGHLPVRCPVSVSRKQREAQGCGAKPDCRKA